MKNLSDDFLASVLELLLAESRPTVEDLLEAVSW